MRLEERRHRVPRIDAQQLGDVSDEAGTLGPKVGQLGALLPGSLQGLERAGGLEVLSFDGGPGGVVGGGSATCEHDVEVTTEAMPGEQVPFGGLRSLELPSGGPRGAAPTGLILCRQDRRVGAIDRRPLVDAQRGDGDGGVQLGQLGTGGVDAAVGLLPLLVRWPIGRVPDLLQIGG